MFILAITCLSEATKPSVRVAARLAQRLNLPLHLHHCSMEFRLAGDHEVPIDEATDLRLRQELEKEAGELRSLGAEVTTELRYGMCGSEILYYARQKLPRLAVMAPASLGLAERLMMSVSAPVPVLVVREPEVMMEWLNGSAPLRLLFGFDFSASAENAVMAAKEWAALGGVEFEAASIRTKQSPDFNEEPLTRQINVLKELKGWLGDVSIRVHVRDVDCQPAGVFLHLAQERHPGLVVIGTHPVDDWSGMWESALSRKVLTQASTNVLCVPCAAPVAYHFPCAV